ncbi:hypothetical protein [Desulfotalea psychrophila]|uniref:hypothetical protein n=1 Tax=Desulfotalea psychrophila TaxID=84980 RepID=UPI00059C8E9D|nr:hypothetical protein [Desulfotalea psychrophila]
MKSLTNTLSFYASIVVYLIFNLRLQGNGAGGIDALSSFQATALQIGQTAPYIAGFTYFIIAILQYMSGGDKVPWDRRVRLFMALGILGGLFMGIYEYAGVIE